MFDRNMKNSNRIILVVGASLICLLLSGFLIVVQDIDVKPKRGARYTIRKYSLLWSDRPRFQMDKEGEWMERTRYVYGCVSGEGFGGRTIFYQATGGTMPFSESDKTLDR